MNQFATVALAALALTCSGIAADHHENDGKDAKNPFLGSYTYARAVANGEKRTGGDLEGQTVKVGADKIELMMDGKAGFVIEYKLKEAKGVKKKAAATPASPIPNAPVPAVPGGGTDDKTDLEKSAGKKKPGPPTDVHTIEMTIVEAAEMPDAKGSKSMGRIAKRGKNVMLIYALPGSKPPKNFKGGEGYNMFVLKPAGMKKGKKKAATDD